jgi:stalled ribosome rescue protein Dom34
MRPDFPDESRAAMSHFHFVVWIDHREAHVIQFNPEDAEASIVHPKSKHEHLHHKQSAVGSGRLPEDHAYYQAVSDAIRNAGEILIVGPSSAKLELFKHLQKHAPAVAARVVSVETVDHPTDGELLKFARRHFEADDRMLPQS